MSCKGAKVFMCKCQSLVEGNFWDVSFPTLWACPVLRQRSHLQLQEKTHKTDKQKNTNYPDEEYQILVVDNKTEHKREKNFWIHLIRSTIKILQIPLLHRTTFLSELKLLSFPYWLIGVMKVKVYLLLNPKRMPASILALVLKSGIFNTYCSQFWNFNGNSDNRSLFQPHYRDFVT